MKKCPYCAEEIQENAQKCRHCNTRIGSKENLIEIGNDNDYLKKIGLIALILCAIVGLLIRGASI